MYNYSSDCFHFLCKIWSCFVSAANKNKERNSTEKNLHQKQRKTIFTNELFTVLLPQKDHISTTPLANIQIFQNLFSLIFFSLHVFLLLFFRYLGFSPFSQRIKKKKNISCKEPRADLDISPSLTGFSSLFCNPFNWHCSVIIWFKVYLASAPNCSPLCSVLKPVFYFPPTPSWVS